MGELLLMFKE